MRNRFRNIVLGIKNLVRWFGIIWGDRDWDWEFLAIMMKRKLEFMRDHGGFHTLEEEDRTLEEILTTIKGLDYLISDVPGKGVQNYKEHEDMMKWAQQSVGEMIGKHMRKWWT
jgi:hypothetical protein